MTDLTETAKNYHQEAEIQQKVAEGLHASLLPWRELLPEGPVLEVGCKTGFLTRLLLKDFPQREFVITDTSREMLRFCKDEMDDQGLLDSQAKFEQMDLNELKPEGEKYAMVISNFAAHWFGDTAKGLQKLTEMLLPGGLLLCAFPGNHSLPAWYENCLELGLPHTANPLPDVEEVVVKLSMGPQQIDYYENDLYQEFDSPLDFFRHLKRIGASESKLDKSLNPKQFRLLLRHWGQQSPEGIKLKWHIVYLAAKKDL